MNEVYLSIGSNIYNRYSNINVCLDLLQQHNLSIINTSSIYKTEPVGYKNQKYFYNIVVHIKTLADIYNFFNITKEIEMKMGRNIKQPKIYPRIIDIDILTYANKIIESKDLTIPHPRAITRDFVIYPLFDIDPFYKHPVEKKSIKQLKMEIKDIYILRKIMQPKDSFVIY